MHWPGRELKGAEVPIPMSRLNLVVQFLVTLMMPKMMVALRMGLPEHLKRSLQMSKTGEPIRDTGEAWSPDLHVMIRRDNLDLQR
jgi:hypothetical protein